MGAVRLTVFEKSNPKVKRCLIFKQKIGEVKAAKSVIFFWQNQSLIGIFYNCDESFCAWLTEISHSGNFRKGAIYVGDFQGSCDTTLTLRQNISLRNLGRYLFWENIWQKLKKNEIKIYGGLFLLGRSRAYKIVINIYGCYLLQYIWPFSGI